MDRLAAELEAIERELCRAKKRADLCDDHCGGWGALGRLVSALKDLRNNRLTFEGGLSDLKIENIIEFCDRLPEGIKPGEVRSFLSGKPGPRQKWPAVAPDLIRFVLGDDRTRPNSAVPKPAGEVVERIVRFFLADHPQVENSPEADFLKNGPHEVPAGGWYFGPFVPTHPISTREAIAEMRHLRHAVQAGNAGHALMVRVVCGDEFRMTHSKALTESGHEAKRCADAGIQQVFVHPDHDVFGSEPKESAKTFASLVGLKAKGGAGAGRVGNGTAAAAVVIKPVDVGQPARMLREQDGPHEKPPEPRHAWEYLHPHFRYTYYRWLDGNQQWGHRLMVSRHPRHGPCMFAAERDERNRFWEWVRLFVLGQGAAVGSKADSTSAKEAGGEGDAKPRGRKDKRAVSGRSS